MKKYWVGLLLLVSVLVNAFQVSPTDMDKAMALMTNENPTSTAIASGDWSNPAVWDTPPAANGFVRIAPDVSVVQDVDSPRLRKVFVEGTLSPRGNVTLTVETLVSSMSGKIQAGTETNPHAGKWLIFFSDNGPITDPWKFSRGAILMGPVALYGAYSDTWQNCQGVSVGGTTVTLNAGVRGWKIGDRIVLPGLNPASNEDDEVTISNIEDKQITFSPPAKFDHGLVNRWGGNRPLIIGNITSKPIEFKSESSVTSRRGHVMCMRSDTMTPFVFNNVSFTDLGRTDKNATLNPLTDPDGLGGGITNERGRYPLHFHRMNSDRTGMEAQVVACLVNGSPGVGFVNHSSYVCFQNCLGYKVFGATFFGEVGDEVGCMSACASIRNTAPILANALPANFVATNKNWATGGHGFFTMGGNIKINGCVATGSPSHAYVVMCLQFAANSSGVMPAGALPILFDKKNLDAGDIFTGLRLEPAGVPQRHSNDSCYGCMGGVLLWSINSNEALKPVVASSYLTDCYLEYQNGGVGNGYMSNIDFKRIKCYRYTGDFKQSGGFSHSGVSTNFRYEDCEVYGCDVGYSAQTCGEDNYFKNCIHKCCTGLWIMGHEGNGSPTRKITIDNFQTIPMTAAELTLTANQQHMFFTSLQNKQQKSIVAFMEDIPVSLYRDGPLNTAANIQNAVLRFTGSRPDYTSLDTVTIDGKRMAFWEDHDSWKFPNVVNCPSIVRNLPNSQAWSQFQVRINSKILAPDTVLFPDGMCYVGSDPTFLPEMRSTKPAFPGNAEAYLNYQQTNQINGYVAIVKDAAGNAYMSAPTNLIDKSWNIVPVLFAGGQTRGVWVWADSTGSYAPSW